MRKKSAEPVLAEILVTVFRIAQKLPLERIITERVSSEEEY
jgi:hypothetical protein